MRHPGGAPAGWGFSYSDMASGYCAALAVLAALWQRGVSRRVGRAVDLAQLEVLAAMIGPLLAPALRGGTVPDGLGNRSPERAAAPHGVYRCRDDATGRERWCAIAVFDDDEWRRFAAALGRPHGRDDARCARWRTGGATPTRLDRLVESWTRERAAEQVMQLLQAAGIAAGVVADAGDLAGDPQLRARGYWVPSRRRARRSTGSSRGSPRRPAPSSRPAPRLGEHTRPRSCAI